MEIRELSRVGADISSIMGTAFCLRLFFSFCAIGCLWVSLLAFEKDSLTIYLVLLYSTTLVMQSFNVIRNFFFSKVLNEYVVKAEIFRTLIGAAIKILLLVGKFSLVWFVLASTLEIALISSGYLFAFVRHGDVVTRWRFKWALARKLVGQAFPLLLSGTAVILYQKIDGIMIRNMISNQSLGQYAVATKFTELAIFIPMVIAQTVTPILVKAHERSAQEYVKKRQQFMDFTIWLAIGIAGVLFLLSGPLVRLLYGDSYVFFGLCGAHVGACVPLPFAG